MDVGCVHGDTRTYETCHAVVRTPRGVFTVRAGIVPNLPVPLLIGRDCPIFHRLWNPESGPRPRRTPPRRYIRPGRPAYGARVAHSSAAESSEEGDETRGGGGRTPGHSTGGPHREDSTPALDTPDTVTATEPNGPPRGSESSPLTEFSDFSPTRGGATDRPGQFASAQLQDDALKHAWSHVLAHDGQARESVSNLPHPHFSTRAGLLYRVIERGGVVTEQLVVPRSYVSKVLFMAHSHLLGAHLGMDKTRDRILDRFYWPGVKRDVTQYCQACSECQRTAPRPSVRNPLIPMPIIEVPFDRLALDIVGPLPKTSRVIGTYW